MLIKGLFVVYLTCMVFCYGTVEDNFNTRIKRQEDDQSITEGNMQSTKNDEPISRDNKDFINLRIGDVTRALSENVPKLSTINNILPSIPLPVQLLLKDNNQNNELNTKPHNLQGKESNEISNNNKMDSNKPPIKRRPSKKINNNKIGNNNNDNAEINDISRTSQTPKQIDNNKHNLILENKLNNRNINTEYIISPKDYNKERLFDEAIIPLLTVLGNSLKLNEFDTNSVYKQKSIENKNPEVNKVSNSLNTKDLSNVKLTKILEEQNNLLKDILFKTLNYKKETKDIDEKDTKKIHLILDINNSEDNKNDNPDNAAKKRNNLEKLLNTVLYHDRNNTQQNTDEDKNENGARLEETLKDLKNDTANEYVYFNDRNIKTYIYSTNAKKNELSRRLYNYKTKPRHPYTEVDWKRYNDMENNQNIRVIFIPRDEVKIIPSKNYEMYKKFQSNQLYQYAMPGLNLDRKFISKCPYHGLNSSI